MSVRCEICGIVFEGIHTCTFTSHQRAVSAEYNFRVEHDEVKRLEGVCLEHAKYQEQLQANYRQLQEQVRVLKEGNEQLRERTNNLEQLTYDATMGKIDWNEVEKYVRKKLSEI